MNLHPLPLAAVSTGPARRRYLTLLTWAFAFFNGMRVLTYLPTIWAIHDSGQSNQHSLLTWLGWMGANLTMAAWLHEQNGGHFDRAVAVNTANAVMCGVTTLLIVCCR